MAEERDHFPDPRRGVRGSWHADGSCHRLYHSYPGLYRISPCSLPSGCRSRICSDRYLYINSDDGRYCDSASGDKVFRKKYRCLKKCAVADLCGHYILCDRSDNAMIKLKSFAKRYRFFLIMAAKNLCLLVISPELGKEADLRL